MMDTQMVNLIAVAIAGTAGLSAGGPLGLDMANRIARRPVHLRQRVTDFPRRG
jgi:hypothetical protein